MTSREKQQRFYNELKALLRKYNAELCLVDMGREFHDYKMMVDFIYDESMFEEHISTQLLLHSYENGE